PNGNRLLRNDGAGLFVDVTPPVLDGGSSGGSVAAAWADYDRDGDLDLYLVRGSGNNALFRNDGGGIFTNVTTALLAGSGTGTAVAWGDYDGDGDPDLFLVSSTPRGCRLLRNDGAAGFAAVSFPAASGNDAAWGDRDGDGDLD